MQAMKNSSDLLSNETSSSAHIFGGNLVNVVKENIQTDHFRNEINPDQIINGYKFGGTYVPFSGTVINKLFFMFI